MFEGRESFGSRSSTGGLSGISASVSVCPRPVSGSNSVDFEQLHAPILPPLILKTVKQEAQTGFL